MKIHSLLAIISTTLLPIAVRAQAYTVQELNPAGYAQAISNGVVGGNASTNGHAMLWTATGAVDVHPDIYRFSGILGRSGDISVGYGTDATFQQTPLSWNGIVSKRLRVPFEYVTGYAVATDGTQIVGSANPFDAERGTGPAHALLWTVGASKVVDLGSKSVLQGVGGGVQVGYFLASKGAEAAMWRGTGKTRVDLHPQFADASVATGTNGAIETGYYGVDVRVHNEARPRKIRFYSAGFWSGSADSFTSLNSPYRHSFAMGIRGDTIIGYGTTTDPIGFPIASHAMAWVGDDHALVDLHALLPAYMKTSTATSVDEFGNIAGYGIDFNNQLHSFVWNRIA